jgi:hypothetical protein
MYLFHLSWFRCLDGYRIETLEPPKSTGSILTGTARKPSGRPGGEEDDGDLRVILPNSSRWEATEPLKVPGAYRQWANWDGSDEGILKLINGFGFVNRAKSEDELVLFTQRFISGLATYVDLIERREWKCVADTLTLTAQHRAGGVGACAVHFDVSGGGLPTLRLEPRSLGQALIVQALADATLGTEHRKCKNPECDRYFPVSGPESYRIDAEYHSEQCRRRHAYLIKKASLTRKKERRR